MQKKILSLKNIYPFHMPGHKRNKKFIYKNLLDLDFTEICGLDNLQRPCGIIKRAEFFCAQVFNCDKSFFCVNGASVAVLAAIFAICQENEEIIVMRESHQSLYHALELRNLTPKFIYNKSFYAAPDYGDFEFLLKKSAARAIFVTSPNYLGFCLDIKKIAELAKKHKKILIVDEAHGAHFVFNKNFPESAIKSGANIVINSLHKTLPCLTQSAVLNIKRDNLIDISRVKKYLNMFQTSSPSYIFMSVMENSLKKLSRRGFYDNYIKKLFFVREELGKNKIFKLVNKKDIKKLGFCDLDISKLVFLMNIKKREIDIEKILREKFKLGIEMRGRDYFLALSSIADTDYGFKLLIKAIKNLEKNFDYEYKKLDFRYQEQIRLKSALSLKQAVNKNKRYIELDQSENKICAEYIILYPPGVPLIIPGEIITRDMIFLIQDLLNNKLNIINLKKNFLIPIII